MTADGLLAGKLTRLFPEPDIRRQVESMLADYGEADYEREPARVRLAILKLAGADAEKVAYYLGQARQDYRDVLAWAEYPREMREPPGGGPAIEKLRRADREEYERWLDD